MPICFVIQPFTNAYNERYDDLYKPAIEAAGMTACYACAALIDSDCRKGPHCTLLEFKGDSLWDTTALLTGWESSTYKCRECGMVLIRPNYKHSPKQTWRGFV